MGFEAMNEDFEKKKLIAGNARLYATENLADFENVEIKKISDLPYWDKLEKFLTVKNIADREIILIGDREKWNSVYGSNDSKSSSKPAAIILKSDIFRRENISDDDLSWLIHEIGHIEFYESLGDKLDEYMKNYHASGKYSDSEMEEASFRLQFEFLKSLGKNKDDCLNFMRKYLDKTFAKNEVIAKEKELEAIKKYLDGVFQA